MAVLSSADPDVPRAVDQHGQVIDVYVSRRRDIPSARTFLTKALGMNGNPGEVITDRAPALANVIDDLLPAAFHNTGQYENNRVECDHGRAQGQAPADAWTQDPPHGCCGDPRARVRPELTPRPLRACRRLRTDSPAGDRIRRTPASNLTEHRQRLLSPRHRL